MEKEKKLNQKNKWKIIDLINWSTKYLNSKNIPNSRKETEWFLSNIYKCNRIELYLKYDQIIDDLKLKTFKSYILRRLKHEPFQYIINQAPFYGRDFYVNKNVLIPRPETELIIDILKNKFFFESTLDIGTGSGCLAITLKLEKITNNILAIDKFDSALTIANQNSNKFKCSNIIFKKIDILKTKPPQKFDLVISNPPYISIEELKTLDENVINYEPLDSLTDKNNGLFFFKRFDEIYDDIIKPGGRMILEFGGKTQVELIKKIFSSKNYKLSFYKDLNNDERVLEIIKQWK